MAHLFELYCEDRLIGKNKTATQIAELMGITVGQVTAYAKSGELINGRYKVVRIPEKFEPEHVPLMSEWEKVTEPFRRVIWCKHLTDGVRQLGGGLKWRC